MSGAGAHEARRAGVASTIELRTAMVIGPGSESWTMALFAVGLGLSRIANVWLMVALAALGALALVARVVEPRRVSRREVLLGCVLGVGMLAVTHGLYAVAADLLPALREQARWLYGWLEDAPGPLWASPVLTLAVVAEEVVFRGLLVDALEERWSRPRVAVVGVLLYALPQLATGTWLLPLVAVVCGGVWMALRLWTGGLTVPLLTHLIWSLGVFAALPLPI